MARKSRELTLKITHNYAHNPEAVERGLELWATYLARHIAKRASETAQLVRKGTA